MHWIEPIKEQLNRLERRFEQLSAPGTAGVLPKLPRSAPSSRANLTISSKPKPSFSAATSPSPSFSAASSPGVTTLSSNDFPPTPDDMLEEEAVDGSGMCVSVYISVGGGGGVSVCMCMCVGGCARGEVVCACMVCAG